MSFRNLLLCWFRKRTPSRIFVVIGDPNRAFTEPNYTTDPRVYELPVFKRDLTDQDFEDNYRANVKAFLHADDAIDFAYHCNLASVQLPVYIKSKDGWIYSAEETGKLVDSVDW